MYSLDLFMYSRLLPLILDCTQTDVNDIRRGVKGNSYMRMFLFTSEVSQVLFFILTCVYR